MMRRVRRSWTWSHIVNREVFYKRLWITLCIRIKLVVKLITAPLVKHSVHLLRWTLMSYQKVNSWIKTIKKLRRNKAILNMILWLGFCVWQLIRSLWRSCRGFHQRWKFKIRDIRVSLFAHVTDIIRLIISPLIWRKDSNLFPYEVKKMDP